MNRYTRRRNAAMKSVAAKNYDIMSIIIDGMDQQHCLVPNKGSQSSFKDPLKQMITGVKVHGVGLYLYRTIDTVKKGADLTIYCILSQIDRWRCDFDCYPEELYVQLDGGSENANQYVLAALELLVIKRIVRKVLFTRLPTGHTHDDIDACFSKIWEVFKGKPCETLQMYKELIVKGLAKTKLNPQMIDVMVVPNYQQFFGAEGIIDSKLSRLHKEVQTQHQWKFEAVAPSVLFPLGCKTMYRAYSSDVVVEIAKKPKQQCVSVVGQYTGLEPMKLYVRWYPSAECISSRLGIEGFYLIRKVPHCENNWLDPLELSIGSSIAINKCIAEVESSYDIIADAEIRDAWEEWRENYAPLSDDADRYLLLLSSKNHPYHIPLCDVYLDGFSGVDRPRWGAKLDEPLIQTDYIWPEVLARANPSVVTEFTPNPPEPRTISVSDEYLESILDVFDRKCASYHASLQILSKKALEMKVQRRVSYNGIVPSTTGKCDISCKFYLILISTTITGNKSALIQRIKTMDAGFLTGVFRPLVEGSQLLVDRVLAPVDLEELLDEFVCSINQTVVTRRILHSFRPATNIQKDAMVVLLELLRKRDNRICVAHRDVNHRRSSRSTHLPSIFCQCDTLSAMMQSPTDLAWLRNQISLDSWKAAWEIYLPIQLENGVWNLLLIRTKDRKAFLFDPHYDISKSEHRERFGVTLNSYSSMLNTIMPEISAGATPNGSWQCEKFPFEFYEVLENDFDSGLYVFMIMYFLAMDCPLYFEMRNMHHFRKLVVYSVLCEDLGV